MKISVICKAGVHPQSLLYIDYVDKDRGPRICILIFETLDIRLLEALYNDPDVMSFEVSKPEMWKDFFPLKPLYGDR